jgi:hypothetical protein
MMFRDTCGAQAGAYKLAFLRAAFVLQTDFEMQKRLVASETATVRDLQVRFDNSMQCKSVKSGKGFPRDESVSTCGTNLPMLKEGAETTATGWFVGGGRMLLRTCGQHEVCKSTFSQHPHV